MSFATPRPFFPYHEPENQRKIKNPPSRSLRVYFLSDERVNGAIWVRNGVRKWPGATTFSAANFNPVSLAGLAGNLGLKSEQLPQKARLTTFEDFSSPRPGFGDVYFSRSGDQSVIEPPPIIEWVEKWLWIPPDLVALLLWMGYSLLKRRRARLAAA